MNEVTFETALAARVDDMADACTRCGKCVEVCPSVQPAGIAEAKPADVIGGIIDILRTGDGPDISRQWASACTLSGECIKETRLADAVTPQHAGHLARLGGERHVAQRLRRAVMQIDRVNLQHDVNRSDARRLTACRAAGWVGSLSHRTRVYPSSAL